MDLARIELEHVSLLSQMNRRLIEDEGHPDPMSVPELADRMHRWLHEGYLGYLVYDAGEPVAYCLYRDDGDHYYLRHLYTEREHRRRGYATALLDWMYEHVWTDKTVRLDVLAHNTGAITFYRRYGFRLGCLRMEK